MIGRLYELLPDVERRGIGVDAVRRRIKLQMPGPTFQTPLRPAIDREIEVAMLGEPCEPWTHRLQGLGMHSPRDALCARCWSIESLRIETA